MVANSVYIHIPFCRTHCPYCDFAVWLDHKGRYIEPYLEALKEEISSRTNREKLNTIYFGGGTPSILSPKQLRGLMECVQDNFYISDETEITMEVNPGTVDLNSLSEMRRLGVNRLSIGVQTFSQHLLQKLARGHDVGQAELCMMDAITVGFQNISIDLIFGLPGEKFDDWTNTVYRALSKEGVQHISCYALTVEEKTPFYKLYDGGKHKLLAVEDALADMYAFLQNAAADAGFQQYEVSNFARPGYRSRHNSTYWRCEEFYGFGVSAHEYTEGKRRCHTRNLEDYIAQPTSLEELPTDLAEETFMLALRTEEGLDLTKYSIQFPNREDIRATKSLQLTRLIESGRVELTEDNLRITKAGMFIANAIIGELSPECSSTRC